MKKKKNPKDPDIWVEPQAKWTYAMGQKITKLSSQAEASHVRERQREIEYAGYTLLALGDSPVSK